ncbi:hypothetical protein GobsT_13990 [Gemmata obscuriglobus]|uniref:DUF3883 domain-containing protein n=1 Tax=Gemmata obscuriglobus TaxID=114 RepID=A0A2Z3H2A9_9BACT|nr:DUF3883 domain-containing protein [Gemmata obscuriglobus]AWM40163.1 DUF3883 domain-containing protein [Gemmata obscuriglobus]QEG26654.1 hypothetical protein GobsT_13990 [Gemmata obscuriglobus]VTS02250.1 Uncharacterized protein OS=Myxococcus fulvus (strain ATCC BAA-855 / HW-1) GN=LILAB_21825 PE=4 SV=1: DUF3883 [Gemmata obscuriglobus UQM 2246]
MATTAIPANAAVPTGSPSLLRDLWYRRLDTLISGIANKDTYYVQIANAAEHISAEYHGRFLIELLQNANDQAVRQGLKDTAVTIHWTERLLAIGNSGQPFDEAKVDAITSIFKSDKQADKCLGNKGIGFKAVFQVADSAEIYSAAPGGSLWDGCPTAFRIVRKPFEDETFLADMRDIADELLLEQPGRLRKIEPNGSTAAATEVVLREARRAAGFTFPLPCSDGHFHHRVKALNLTEDVLRTTQTLVVLPLDGTRHADVESAIDEMQDGKHAAGGGPTGTAFLFLPGIATITIVDHVRDCRVELKKEETAPLEELSPGVTLRRLRTTRLRSALSLASAEPPGPGQDWWVAERFLGEGDDKDAANERDAIREAIEALRLPEENWQRIEKIPVAVALPQPVLAEKQAAATLGPSGLFCIGLPTRVSTGLPLWVSSHFHGKIDRTAIDFDSRYNDLLFDAAVELAGELLERFKREPERTTRRLVTLAMERTRGALADAFYAPDGFARGEVVLANTDAFLKASDLRLPKAADLALFRQLTTGIKNVESFGFRLPDPILLEHARKVLDVLNPQSEVPDSSYLKKSVEHRSLLEHAASVHRQDGPAFWEPFFTFVLDRFGTQQDALAEQVILPTGKTDLSSAKARVFFPPVRPARAAGATEKTQAVEDAGDELATIEDGVAAMLRFFDDSAVTIRVGATRDYTPLAQRLAPDSGRGLVRQPRQDILINDALIPALHEARGDHDRMLALLRQALIWLATMSQKLRQRVTTDSLLVPVSGTGDAWAWTEPTNAYFGKGWSHDPNIALLARAYGSRSNTLLIPWDRFEKRVGQRFKDADRRWWLDRMKDIGVADCPRIRRTTKPMLIAEAKSYNYLTPYLWLDRPLSCPDALWKQYLRTVCQRMSQTKTGQTFYLNEVAWIDGLEDDAVRPLVVEAMLRKPGLYASSAGAKLSRHSGEDSSDVPALWVHALCAEKWDTIPTGSGLRSPQRAWFLPLESRDAKAERFAFLTCVKPEFGDARGLLRALGIVSLEEASIARLAMALHEVAEHIPKAGSDERRHIEALASDLYEAIDRRLKGTEQAGAVKALLGAPVPLLRGDELTSAKLNETDRVLIDDDSIRRRHVAGFREAWVLPRRFQHTYRELVNALRTLLGSTRVARVSELPIDVPFNPLAHGVPLVDYLRDTVPERLVAEDLALLILKGATQATLPTDEAFRAAWRLFSRTSLIRGRFEGTMSERACFDAQRAGGPALLVDSTLAPHEVVSETWQLLGTSYRPLWTAYAQELRAGACDQFFQDYGTTATERMEVKVAIGLGFERRLRHFQPICLALWDRDHPDGTLDDFRREWSQHARSPETASAWLAWPDLHVRLETASRVDEPQGSLSLLKGLGLSVAVWQSARTKLGEPRWRFAPSERHYTSARDAVAGHLMAWFAYLVVPRSSGPTVPAALADDVAGWVGDVRRLAVPTEVAEETLNPEAIVGRVARDALALAAPRPTVAGAAQLVDPLRKLSESPPSELSALKLKDEPDKSAGIYERDDEIVRAQQAGDAVNIVLKVAGELAPKFEETIDPAAITGHALVTLLSQGFWGNRVAVIAAVRDALEAAAPRTAARMKERSAFREVEDWRSLWKKFEELGDIPAPPAPAPPKPTFNVLSAGWTREDFETSAAKGPAGTVAQNLEAAVNPALNLAAIRSVSRGAVQRPTKRGRPGAGSGGGARTRVSEDYLAVLGAVGEYFVYQQLKALCPDFDLTNWLSKGRERFGFSAGNDTLGYDFSYDDVTGALAGSRIMPRCLIEVKSSAHDGGSVFEMTTNEWEVAQGCHGDPKSGTYVIIRVANLTSKPCVTDVLVDPVQLHLDGVLDYTSRDLLIILGAPK